MLLSTATDRAANRRVRVWADGVLGRNVVAEWKTHPQLGLQSLDLRPCVTAPCGVLSPLITELQARVVSGPPQQSDFFPLSKPALPAIEHPTIYPKFTDTPHGITYIADEGRLGRPAEVAGIKRCASRTPAPSRARRSASSRSRRRAIRPSAPDSSSTRPVVATADDPERPLYVDGILSRCPTSSTSG